MHKYLVSIIIPTFNRANLLRETLDSVLQQDYTYWECLVIDDGATDNTKSVITSFISKDQRFKYFKRPQYLPKGANACRNYGFEKSKGQFITWFDDDDIMLPKFLSSRINKFNDGIEFIIGLGTVVDNNLNVLKTMRFNRKMPLFKGVVNWQNEIITNSVLFKKAFLEHKNLFNEHIFRGQETEFFSRLFFNTNDDEYLVIEDPIFLYRQHLNSKTQQNDKYVPIFRRSHTYIAIENFKRSISLEDKDLITVTYKNTIYHFFRALEHKHHANSSFILKTFTPELIRFNKTLGLKFKAIGYLLKIINRGFYSLEMYFKNHSL